MKAKALLTSRKSTTYKGVFIGSQIANLGRILWTINASLQIVSEIRYINKKKINTIVQSYVREIFIGDRARSAIWESLAI